MKTQFVLWGLMAALACAPSAASEREAGAVQPVSSATTEVQLSSRDVRLSDVAIVPQGAADPIIAKLPRGVKQLEWDEQTARRMIRNRLPAQRAALTFKDALILRPAPDATALRTGKCFAASERIAKGEFIASARVESAPCGNENNAAPIGYDREARAPIAEKDITAGAYLGAIRPITDRRLAKDANVVLVTGGGPVTITRSVTTMQAGREGRSVLIRTLDGAYFTVPVSNLSEDLAQ